MGVCIDGFNMEVVEEFKIIREMITIVIIAYLTQFIVVLLKVAADVLEVKEYQDKAFVYYKSMRQILIDLIPGSWILMIVRPVGRWYKTLK